VTHPLPHNPAGAAPTTRHTPPEATADAAAGLGADLLPLPGPRDAKKHRITGLDALRGIAAFSVVVGHYTHQYHHLYRHNDQLLFRYPWAPYGVTLFFMISGFVILMTVDRTARPSDFVWARFTRLYPAYWAAVAITFTVLTIFTLPGRTPTLPQGIVNLTMVQNWVGVKSIDGVYWTLHVEVYFYLMMFVLLWRGWVRYTEFVLLGLVALAAVRGAFFPETTNPWLVRAGNVLILDNAFAFAIGVLLYRSIRCPRPWHALAIAGCIAYTFFFLPRLDFYVTYGLAGLMFLTTRGYLKFLDSRALVLLGTISYSLYLTHQNIGYLVIRAGYKLGLNPNVSVVIAIAFALLLASVITFLIERPAMSFLRERRPRFLRAPEPCSAPHPTAPVPA
jgi:peptidoglycan/LPS O-acetylase OafA/YrhL